MKNDNASKVAIAHRIGRSSVASMASLSGISSSAVMMGPPPPPPPLSSSSAAAVASGASSSNQYLTAMPTPSIYSSSSGPGSLNESALVEPLDYEEFVTQQQRLIRGQVSAGNNNILVDFPPDDIEVNVVPRKIRTLGHVLPEEPMDQLDAIVQNCVNTYTSDWVVVRRRYHHHSSSIRPIDDLDECLKEPLPHQEFEADETLDNSPDFEVSFLKLFKRKID